MARISESLAKRLWPQESAAAVVGHSIRQGDVTGPPIAVVGVIPDVRAGLAERELPPMVYRPHPQWTGRKATLIVRTAQDSTALARMLRVEIRKLNPNVPIPAIRTMREVVSTSLAQRAFQVALTSLFALVALLLGAVGVYGAVSYSVASQSREIGFRLALGARSGDVLRQVLGRGMRPVAAGLAMGLAGAVTIATALRSLLFGVAPTDPVSLGGVVLVLLTSGLACYLPARGAAGSADRASR